VHVGPSQQRPLARFPPPQVYHDPEIAVYKEGTSGNSNSQNLETSKSQEPFPPAQVFQDPDLTTYEKEEKRMEGNFKEYAASERSTGSSSIPQAYSQADPRQVGIGMNERAERPKSKLFSKLMKRK
jgi:hypothetical protein